MAYVLLLTDTQLERICERSAKVYVATIVCVIMMAIWKAISMMMTKFHKKG